MLFVNIIPFRGLVDNCIAHMREEVRQVQFKICSCYRFLFGFMLLQYCSSLPDEVQ